MTNNERDLLVVARDLLEICRIKCSPTDEVWRADGISNEQVMIAAMATIKRAEEHVQIMADPSRAGRLRRFRLGLG